MANNEPRLRIVFCPKCGQKMAELIHEQAYECPDGHKQSLATVLMRLRTLDAS